MFFLNSFTSVIAPEQGSERVLNPIKRAIGGPESGEFQLNSDE